jgi:hypothetical protein
MFAFSRNHEERWEASMLPEIILLRLEIALRVMDEAGPVAAPRFVPLARGVKPQFKRKLAAV